MARKIVTDRDRRRTRQALLKGCLAGCLVVVLLACALVFIGYRRLTATPPSAADQLRRSAGRAHAPDATPPSETAPTPAAPHAPSPSPAPSAPVPRQVPALEQQVREVARAAQTPGPQPVVMHVPPAELRDALAARLEGKGLDGLDLAFGYGEAIAQGRAKVRGHEFYTTVRVKPRIEEGKLRLDVHDARIGTFPAPSGLKEQFQKEVDKGVAKSPVHEAPVWWDSVDVTPEGMILQGRTIGDG